MELQTILSKIGPGYNVIREHALIYHETRKRNSDLNEEISSIVRYYSNEIIEAIGHESANPAVEEQRKRILARKKDMLLYTNILKFLMPLCILVFIAGTSHFGSGSSGAKTIYICFVVAVIAVFAVMMGQVYRVNRSIEDYVLECIVAYEKEMT